METKPVHVECPLCLGTGKIFAKLKVPDLTFCFAAWKLQKEGMSLREIAKTLGLSKGAPQLAKYYIEKWESYMKELGN